MKAWPWPSKFSALMIALMLSRSVSAPLTPISRPWCCTGVARVITSLLAETEMYGSVTMDWPALVAALYQPRTRGS
ncbi:hypothetical protein D3C76_1429290 [compost metagenome]